MKINPKLKKRIFLVVIILVCLCAAVLFLRYRKSEKKDEKEIYVENKLGLAASYIHQGFANPQEPKFFNYALQQYEEILKANPKQKEAMLGLAEVYTQKENYAAAEKLYKRVITLDQKNTSYQVSFGFHYLSRGLKDKALERANLATSYDPKNIRAYQLRAIIYQQERNLSGAIIEYIRGIAAAKTTKKLADQEAELRFRLSYLLQKEGLNYEAVQQFEKVLKRWPKYSQGYLELAAFYFRSGMVDKSISTLNSLVAFDKKSPRAYSLLGMAYLRKQDYVASYANFKRAKSLGAEVNDAFLENLNKAIQKEKEAQQGKKENAEKNN